MAANSFNQIYIHFVIVVKDRAKLITPTIEPVLHKYISSIIDNRKNKTLIINGSKDHLHILIAMHSTESPSSLMLCVKQYSTKFLKAEGLCKNLSVHLSVLKTLPSIIEESIEVEIHSDYTKVNGQRSINSPINKKVLIHIFYGCVAFSNSIYRIKTIIKEFSDIKRNNKPYTFEVIKIELLDISSNSILTANGPNFKCKTIEGLSTSIAKILQNVEKSYDKGKFLLEETKKHAEIVAEFCKFYFSKEKHSKNLKNLLFFRS